MNMKGKEEQRQLWIARMSDLGSSGMTQEEWCRSHNIPYSTFRYWVRKLKKDSVSEDVKTNWLKVDMSEGNEVATFHISESGKTNNGCISIRFGDFTVELQTGFSPQQVFEVLQVLKAL